MRKQSALPKPCLAGAGCGLSAGVSSRTHLRWPTPVRPRRTVVSKDGFPDCWGETSRGRKGKPKNSLSTLWGPRPVFRRSRRRQASSRNSLPALNAAAVVQAAHPVQCVLRKRDRANAEASKCLRPPAVADSCPAPPDTRIKGRISRCFGREHRGQVRTCRPEGRLSTLWGPGRRQEPGRRAYAGGIHSRR